MHKIYQNFFEKKIFLKIKIFIFKMELPIPGISTKKFEFGMNSLRIVKLIKFFYGKYMIYKNFL